MRRGARGAIGVALAVLLVAPAGPLGALIAPAIPSPTATAAAAILPPAPAAANPLPPVVDPHLPTLDVAIALDPDPIALGQPATITVTVTNRAPDPAADLALTLPVPAGATAITTPTVLATAPTGTSWTWNQPQLAAHGTARFTAGVRVDQPPPGGALILTPSATAQGLPMPVAATGGALVVDPAQGAASVPFAPGSAATLQSADGRVSVQAPAGAAAQALTLRHDRRPAPGETAPPAVALARRGFGTFFLSATDSAGAAVHQFAQPLTVSVRYTPEELRALGIGEGDLRLFWYDPDQQWTPPDGAAKQGLWKPIPTAIDQQAHTATATVSHFSAFQLSDGSSPSKAYLPSLEGWGVDTFTGAATYRMPIAVPAGPGGIAPHLALDYRGDRTDGATGERPLQQAGWVGKGWSLETPAVELRMVGYGLPSYYTLALGGQSFNLVRGSLLPATPAYDPNDMTPTHWQWRSSDETFLRVLPVPATDAPANRGGSGGGATYPRYKWLVFAKDGTRYEFADDAWWAWTACGGVGPASYMEAYRWQLTTVTDPHGNTIAYAYDRDTAPVSDCNGLAGTVDTDIRPRAITWGAHVTNGVSDGNDRYRVEFVASSRPVDGTADSAPNQLGGAPTQSRQLDYIKVESKRTGAVDFELVREYMLVHTTTLPPTLVSDHTINGNQPDPATYKLTLINIVPVASDGATQLPPLTFSYGLDRGADIYPAGAWNRLTHVDNGQGGTVDFAYENIGQVSATRLFENNRRVTRKTVTDLVTGTSGAWAYSYGGVEMNSLGVNGHDPTPWQPWPNSAALYFNYNQFGAYGTPSWGAHIEQLAIPADTEFRGHQWTMVTAPNGLQTRHWFYQGDLSEGPDGSTTMPTVTGTDLTAYDNDPNFAILRNHEALVGREYRTELFDPTKSTTVPVRKVERTFVLGSHDYAQNALSGLWHAWTYESRAVETLSEGTGPTVSRTTKFTENLVTPPNTPPYAPPYVNQVMAEEDDQSGAPYRTTAVTYAANNAISPADGSGSYLVERPVERKVTDAGGATAAWSRAFYDGGAFGTVGAKGELTKTSGFIDTAGTQSADATYGYDAYGNRTTATTFTGANGTGTARTTTTAYDADFHAFPLSVTAPLPGLVEQAAYDFRMGTLTGVTDPNGNLTTAGYDLWGRLTTLVKPGDTAALPTRSATYYDWEYVNSGTAHAPFHYALAQRETSGQSAVHYTQQFLDGLGRPIQTKRELIAGTVNAVTDTVYDGEGHAIKGSQPRAVPVQTAPNDFFLRVPLAADATERWTTTAFDAQARPTVVTAPDGTTTRAAFAVTTTGPTVTATDPNGHQTTRARDLFGCLTTVTELSGNGGSEGPYATYATTTYQYNALDLLTRATDAQGNVTTRTYDALGRTLTASDPDLGAWSYQYDAAGNRTQQTDATHQITGFGYDALDRPVSRSGADTATLTYDAGTNGKGQRTGASNPAATLSSTYDSRGRLTGTTASVAGQVGTWTTTYGYDAADRPTSVTYPQTSEVVTTTYDAAGRATSLCTNTSAPCYATAAQYTALDQPSQLTLGNTLLAQWSYTSPMQRLAAVQVGASPQSPSTAFDRTYSYDSVGNVTLIHNALAREDQRFTYDHRDRLVHACTASPVPGSPCDATNGGYDETEQYDPLGNLTSKGGVAAVYPGTGLAHPHAPSTVGSAQYTYDANGNMTSGGGKSITWDARNLPSAITVTTTPPPPPSGTPSLTAPSRGPAGSGSPSLTAPNRGGAVLPGTPNLTAPSRGSGTQATTTESYTYDADGQRVTRTANGITTVYIGGVFEQDIQGGVLRSQYSFAGHMIAQRTQQGASTTLVYLHGDHLGSVSVATSSTGAVLDRQEYGPWGNIRSGGVSETTLNYTGQKRDGTGLLYYGARYYDPGLGRFLSPDSMGTSLTNPQTLNRYAYVGNNPLNHTDPMGHDECLILDANCAAVPKPAQSPNPIRNVAGVACAIVCTGAILCAVKCDQSGSNSKDNSSFRSGTSSDDVSATPRRSRDKSDIEISNEQNWGRADTLEKHTLDHARDFGLSPYDREGYAKQAREFFEKATDPTRNAGIEVKVDEVDKVTRYYEEKTNTLGVYNNEDDSTATFFKPREGRAYWDGNKWDNEKEFERDDTHDRDRDPDRDDGFDHRDPDDHRG